MCMYMYGVYYSKKDVVFTNWPSLIIVVATNIPGICDHDAVLVSFHIEMTQKDTMKHKKYLWSRANICGKVWGYIGFVNW